MDSPFLGMIQYFAFDWAPRGYALASGQLLPISQNQALFALFGTYYGGDGRTTFGIPDLRGRAVIGQSNTHTIGEKFGATGVTLLTTNMPSHTHTASGQFDANSGLGAVADPTNAYPAGLHPGRGTGTMYTSTAESGKFLGAPSVTVVAAGGNVPMSTQNPSLVVTATVCTSGLFPSRN